MIAAGTLSSEHALKPEREPEPPVVDDPGSITIEVAPTALHAVAEAPRDLGEIDTSEGVISCPNCNGHAHLDMVDLVGHTMHYTCMSCGAMWQIRQPAIDNVIR